jgi:hypothetical protein
MAEFVGFQFEVNTRQAVVGARASRGLAPLSRDDHFVSPSNRTINGFGG